MGLGCDCQVLQSLLGDSEDLGSKPQGGGSREETWSVF